MPLVHEEECLAFYLCRCSSVTGPGQSATERGDEIICDITRGRNLNLFFLYTKGGAGDAVTTRLSELPTPPSAVDAAVTSY